MADMSAVHDKITKMAGMMGASPDTVSKMKDEMTKKASATSTPSTTVVVAVKKWAGTPEMDYEDMIQKLSDQDIDKMSEQEAKDYLKKTRDAIIEDEKEEGETETGPEESDSKPSLQDAFNKAGGMY